ncbi:MAG: hypothetical protein LQ346_004124 [Caloplaca aetnensis]|nr:MAG: hypothetical protein LQ346_004124 [Caloplaca aetnensis]
MSVTRFGAGDLLEYNSRYGLLICRECQYAIQKTALESHLLRHKIYRGDRQRLLSSIAHCNLLEPHQVPLPAPGLPPVDALATLSGYCCTEAGCRHLTASSKRMKRHWSGAHGLASSSARAVKLQTFFRGTKVRYFEVASPTTPLVNMDEDDDNDHWTGDDDHEGHEGGGLAAITVTPPPQPPQPPRVPAFPGAANGLAPVGFDMETLTYFHHFITITSLTLPGGELQQSSKHYWQTDVVSRALRRRWLMCGLLAISAHHLVVLAHDTMTKQTHRERGLQFSSEFFTGIAAMTGCDIRLEMAGLEDETRKAGEQIKCFLRCVQQTLAEPTLDCDPMAPCSLLSIMSTVQGCVLPASVPPETGISYGGHERQEESFVSGFPHPASSAHDGNPDSITPSDNTPSALLTFLRALPARIAEGLAKPESVQDVFATLSAVDALVRCCGISFACDEAETGWRGTATWAANVPDHFNQMVRRNHPAALVVLAYWAAILVKRTEQLGCWFLKGSANMIVLQVVKQLSADNHAVLGLVQCLIGSVRD